ncbi:pyridoxamine 5'-phosphate oxidase family protein [Gordonia sp. CPCC 205333]|uniref:pyridoxamine 5'-phosphate oxidase family protein n=1 Tax=Gordonia sp. CPCC 205333 TaxID=3140790 RepID=UPI003AF3F835
MPEMTPAAADAFLRDVHVGVLAIERSSNPPLAIPIWYDVDEAGNVIIWTGADSVKARLIGRAGRASFTVQRETVPYAYVTVEGHTSSAAADDATARRIARRYLGEDGGDEFLKSSPVDGNVIITIHKDKLRSLTYDN